LASLPPINVDSLMRRINYSISQNDFRDNYSGAAETQTVCVIVQVGL
jgi:hypothetical protein